MQIKRPLLITFSLFIVFFLGSCSDKDNYDPGDGDGNGQVIDKDNQSVNDWMYDEMSMKYYWNTSIPESSKLNFNKKPDAFFGSLLYRYNTAEGDRFSYLEKGGIPYTPDMKATTSAARSQDLGFEYRTVEDRDKHSGAIIYYYYVAYTKKGTDAEKKLTRGNIIRAVNGTVVNEQNWRSLLDSGASQYSLRIEGKDKEIVVSSTRGYVESPVYLSKTITLRDNRKVGYLVYNFFDNDNNNGSMDFAVDLNNRLQEFESQRINEFVLDLRYNPGGLVESGTYLASALVPNRKPTMKYTTRKFNDRFDAYLQNYYKRRGDMNGYDKEINNYFRDQIAKKGNEIPRLNMTRIYVLTTQNTASASEQIINGLRGHDVTVEVIGEVTTGKNMESFEIRQNNRDPWILHPLTSKSYNTRGESEYWRGFAPTIGGRTIEFEFHDEQGVPTLYPLGDEREILLSTALNHMQGIQRRTTRSLSKPTVASTSEAVVVGSSIERRGTDMIIKTIDLE